MRSRKCCIAKHAYVVLQNGGQAQLDIEEVHKAVYNGFHYAAVC